MTGWARALCQREKGRGGASPQAAASRPLKIRPPGPKGLRAESCPLPRIKIHVFKSPSLWHFKTNCIWRESLER